MKKRWMKIVRNIIIAGVIALIPLSGFQYFWRYNAVSVRDESGATGNKHEPNAWNANMEEGFSWVRMDDNGYNNLVEKQGEIDILLMGSSHLDGLQVGADQNCGYVLNQLLPEEYTYSLGMTIHSLDVLVQRVEAAVAEYHPTSYVVLETSSIDMTIDAMDSALEKEDNSSPYLSRE